MPLYEYECLSCTKKFEKLCRSLAERDTANCPICGGQKVKRLVSAFFSGKSRSAEDTSSSASCAGCQRTSCAGCK